MLHIDVGCHCADQFDDTFPMNLIGDMNQEGEKSLSSEMKSTEALKADLHAHIKRVNDDLSKGLMPVFWK